MATTITPAVSGTHAKWIRNVFLHFLGLLIGGAASVALAELIFLPLIALIGRDAALGIACALACIGLLHEIDRRVPVPYKSQQVPVNWRRDLGGTGLLSFMYGAMLGVGFLTLFTSSAQLTLVAFAPFAPGLTVFAAVVLYAFGKTLVVFTAAGTRSQASALSRIRGTAGGRGAVLTRRAIGGLCTGLMIFAAIMYY